MDESRDGDGDVFRDFSLLFFVIRFFFVGFDFIPQLKKPQPKKKLSNTRPKLNQMRGFGWDFVVYKWCPDKYNKIIRKITCGIFKGL